MIGRPPEINPFPSTKYRAYKTLDFILRNPGATRRTVVLNAGFDRGWKLLDWFRENGMVVETRVPSGGQPKCVVHITSAGKKLLRHLEKELTKKQVAKEMA